MRKRRGGSPQRQHYLVVSQQRHPPWAIVEASFVAAASEADQLPLTLGVELAFCGRSNVGKSSLMNALMARHRLVRTSATPGCTRGINFFSARSRDGAVFQLVDLPGYGFAKRSKDERRRWAKLIEQYLSEREWLRAAVLLVDARRTPSEQDRELMAFIRQRTGQNAPTLIVVATKIDKLANSKKKAALRTLQQQLGERIYPCSAVTGAGIEALWRALRKAAYIVDSSTLNNNVAATSDQSLA